MHWKYWLGTSLLVAGSFAWGTLSHRHNLFPQRLLRDVALKVGFIREVPAAATPSRSQKPALFQSHPYLRARVDPRRPESGVVRSSPGAFAGYNFYNSWTDSSAYLMDMSGEILHEWKHVFPLKNWHHAELMKNGDVLVVVKNDGVAKLDKASNLLWYYPARAHHDLWVHDTGEIYVIAGEARRIPEVHPTLDTLFDKIVVLSPDGKVKDEFSLLELLENSPYRYLLPSPAQMDLKPEMKELDILHTNHVEVFDGRQSGFSPLFKRGNILVSIKHINSIAIIDGASREIIWLWGPTNIAMQHHPTVLDNGNILIFDNGTRQSRIIELNPASRRIAWSYESGDFYSDWGGSSQRLGNGNTLITDTPSGRAFEVNQAGQVVWEFRNPATDSKGARINIWRLTRYRAADLEFLELPGT